MAPEAVIVDVVRTASGKRNGQLSGWLPEELAAEMLIALVERNGLDPGLVDDVIVGCAMQVGAQAANVGRLAVLAADFPESVPATTIDRQCGSSQQAVHFAAQGVMAGAYDIAIAAGVEVMSVVPMGASVVNVEGAGRPFGERLRRRYESAGGLVSQGIAAELIAKQWKLSRADLDAFGAESQRRAAQAASEGRFDREIIPVSVQRSDAETADSSAAALALADEGVRPDTTAESLALLPPAFLPDGVVTAGTSSQIADGASAALVMSRTKATALGLTPRARFHAFSVVGVDPVTMLTGPIPATQTVLDRAGLSVGDIDLFEVNEAFAPVVLAWERELRPDMRRVNVNGGAIALGHALGSSGVRLFATLLNELERTGGRYGLETMCEGGGMANATIIECLQ